MKVPVSLETERLILRRYATDDHVLYHSLINDEKVSRYLPFTPAQKTAEAVRELVQGIVDGYDRPDGLLVLAVCMKGSSEYMGEVALVSWRNGPDHELFCAMFPLFWGKGHATEATARIIDYGFAQPSVGRIIGCIHPGNARSEAMARRAGMTDEGLHDNNGRIDRVFGMSRDRRPPGGAGYPAAPEKDLKGKMPGN